MVRMEIQVHVDTRVADSLISECTKEHLFPRVPLQTPEVALHTYTAEPIPVRRVLEVKVKYKNYTGTQTLYVVEGQGPSLLGCEWLRDIRLNLKSFRTVRL